MTERWIPIVAAVVGLMGGLGGAAIGGSIANEGQEERFRNERLAELNNLLIDTYSRYLRTTANAAAVQQLGGTPRAEEVKVAGDVLSGEAEVRFVTSEDNVEAAAARLRDAALEDADTYEDARDRFIEAAEQSLPPEAALVE